MIFFFDISSHFLESDIAVDDLIRSIARSFFILCAKCFELQAESAKKTSLMVDGFTIPKFILPH